MARSSGSNLNSSVSVLASRSQTSPHLDFPLMQEASQETGSYERLRQRVDSSGIAVMLTSHALLDPMQDQRTQSTLGSVQRPRGLPHWQPGDAEAWWGKNLFSGPVQRTPSPTPVDGEGSARPVVPAFRPGHSSMGSSQQPHQGTPDLHGQTKRTRDISRMTERSGHKAIDGGHENDHALRIPTEPRDLNAQTRADASTPCDRRHPKMPMNPRLQILPELLKVCRNLEQSPGTPHPKDNGIRCNMYGQRVPITESRRYPAQRSRT
ncbi:hypothetical protein BV20DRAFT_977413 [Pilatotrama ljubarskyi]|nr:hypothetical protein BV20DRAFT_977413 [Pilatotrama ljubarskyi]